MKYTSAKANKLLKKLNDDYLAISKKEELCKDFLVSLGENPETVRPDYNFSAVALELESLETKIRAVKHAINLFNVTTVIPELNITIDEALVYIPQLSKLKQKLSQMKAKLPKMREQSGYSRPTNLVEYRYINYDIKEVESLYEKVSSDLTKAQIALDLINNSYEIEINI